jgi:septum site-determining protein MinC
VTASSTLTSFEIKSAQLSLLALLLRTTDLDDLDNDLTLRFGDQPDFFDHDPVLIDLTALETAAGNAPDTPEQPATASAQLPLMSDTHIDFAHLVALLKERRLAPVAVKGGSEAQQQAARAAGLVLAHEADVQTPGDPVREPARESVQKPAQTPSLQSAHAVPPALVISKPLRSGQQVYARGRDLVVLAMVNPGAEVIADGHIHVYAPLRGKAMAGARGNADARIFALVMEPELLSVAGVYRTSETPLPEGIRGRAAQVYLQSTEQGDKLIMEPLA